MDHGLIIPHWDTDGILSAAAVVQSIADTPEIHIPEIGTYTIPAPDISRINAQKYKHIYILDYALQKEIVSQLKAESITVIDHHLTLKAEGVEYCNPVADGADPDKYPCCMAAVSEYCKEEFLLETCIAAAGDKEHKILKNKYFIPKLEKCREKHGLGFNDLMEIKELIDSNYMTGDKSGIQETIHIIIQHGVLSIKDSKNLHDKVKQVTSEKTKLSRIPPEKITETIWFYDLESQMPLLSAVTRLLSKNNPEKIIVTRLNGNVYVRRDKADLDMKPLIETGQSQNWDIGGKAEVCGIVNCTDTMLTKILSCLQQKT